TSASSRKPLCGVLRLVLFPQWFSVGRAFSAVPGVNGLTLQTTTIIVVITLNQREIIIIAEEIRGDSCGSRGLDETPQGSARGGSSADHGKRSVFPKRWF